MPSLPLAKKVKINQSTDYEHHNLLADAFNEKILSGLGDCSWRIFYYAFSMFRGIRNPQDSQFPAQDEWFKFYANLEPKMTYGKFGWPEAQAGEAQGANVANPFMAWIFGNAARVTQANGTKDNTRDGVHGYWSEPIRLSGLELALPDKMPKKISGDPKLNIVWSDSEIQRGCLAFEQNYKYLPRNALQPSTKELQLSSLGICSAARRHLRYVTEAISSGRYAPSYVPDQEGKGGIFRKKNASKDQIEQAIFYYLSFFRGTEDQRARHSIKGRTVITHGFDFEKFFSRQFLLAPNYSRPKYELDSSGKIKTDSLGNKKIKYDSFGYPELFPEGPGSFLWNISFDLAVKNTATNDYFLPTNASDAFLFKGQDESGKELRAFNTNPPGSNNRFCLSAIFIQTSDIACAISENGDSLLSGMFIDIYVDNQIYESIQINPADKYMLNNRTGVVNDTSLNSTNTYKVYQFNKIHYFVYPVKGSVSFKIRGSNGISNASYNNFGSINLGKKIVTQTVTKNNFAITIQFAHVLEMKPSAADAYVMMRVATTEGAGTDAGQMDPVGHFNADTAKTVFTNYIRYGVAYNFRKKTLYQNDAYVSANPVYESARKFITSNVRMADRTALLDYEVNKDGDSVLYFNRYAMGMKNTGVDIFRNMGPSVTEVGNRSIRGAKAETFIPIVKGKDYIVIELEPSLRGTNSHVIYIDNNKKKILKHGATFKGGDYYFVSEYSTGTIGVFELDGITPDSLIKGIDKGEIIIDGIKQKPSGNISNEWTMFMTYNLYHWSNSSYWKPSMYGDIMGALNARCLTASQSLEPFRGTSRNVKQALANVSSRPNDLPLIVEAPSGYNYIESANTKPQYGDWRGNLNHPANFAASCPIYRPPYKIKSIVRLNPYDPKSDIVKVIIENRLQNTGDGTPKGRLSSKIQEFIKFAAVNVDSYRTDENALINYLCHTMAGIQCPRGVNGDVSMDNGNFWQKQRPFGCCYPRFYFVKLIPKVDKNTIMYSDHYIQMEYYLRAMCNGFVNKGSEMSPGQVEAIIRAGLSGINIPGGYDSAIGDYLFEDLMRDSYDNSGDQSVPISPNMVGRQ